MRYQVTIAAWILMATACGATTAPAPPEARVRAVGMIACTTVDHTEGAPVPGSPNGCRTSMSQADGTLHEALNMGFCGPCAFSYDDATTLSERAGGHATACCFRGESPPPPPPPPQVEAPPSPPS